MSKALLALSSSSVCHVLPVFSHHSSLHHASASSCLFFLNSLPPSLFFYLLTSLEESSVPTTPGNIYALFYFVFPPGPRSTSSLPPSAYHLSCFTLLSLIVPLSSSSFPPSQVIFPTSQTV